MNAIIEDDILHGQAHGQGVHEGKEVVTNDILEGVDDGTMWDVIDVTTEDIDDDRIEGVIDIVRVGKKVVLGKSKWNNG